MGQNFCTVWAGNYLNYYEITISQKKKMPATTQHIFILHNSHIPNWWASFELPMGVLHPIYKIRWQNQQTPVLTYIWSWHYFSIKVHICNRETWLILAFFTVSYNLLNMNFYDLQNIVIGSTLSWHLKIQVKNGMKSKKLCNISDAWAHYFIPSCIGFLASFPALLLSCYLMCLSTSQCLWQSYNYFIDI